ncbi:MAG: hypothetical protein IKY52_14200 [Clostridia bacterium]|nr:hypothetical protein [Clostridia bacterium]
MKRTAITFLTTVLALVLLTSCGAEETEKNDAGHTHTYSGWDCNVTEHWRTCTDCGEITDAGTHTVVDGYLCSTCRSEIWDYGDGMYDVSMYDEQGNLVRNTSYAADGTVESEYVHEYTYDADGNVLKEVFYVDGVLTGEDEYTVDAEGERLPVRATYYYDDGSSSVQEYDAFGDTVSYIYLDANNTVINEESYEYAENGDGDRYAFRTTSRSYDEGVIYITEENEYYDTVRILKTDLDGNTLRDVRYEYSYDDEGKKTALKRYENDVLVEEYPEYRMVETDEYSMRFPASIIEYGEDGSKTVSVNGDYGEPVSVTRYDGAGNVTGSTAYTYEVDEDDIIYISVQIEYDGDGNVISEVHFDSEGNEIG